MNLPGIPEQKSQKSLSSFIQNYKMSIESLRSMEEIAELRKEYGDKSHTYNVIQK